MTETTKEPISTSSRARTDESKRLMRKATVAAVITAFTLVCIKAIAWWYTGSIALFGSLLDSILDGAASLVNMFAVKHALEPSDREHRFGHGKAEALAGLGQAMFISLSAFYLMYESYQHFVHPTVMDNSALGIGVTLIAILMTLALVRFQTYVIKQTGSLAITADELHYKGDLLMNVAVIVALVMSGLGTFTWADPLIGVFIAGYILYAAWQIIDQSFDHLMDKELPDEERLRIIKIARGHPEVLDVHDLRTRSSGTAVFIQFHMELDPEISLIKAHTIADEVEALLMVTFPRAEIIIHQDPAGLEELTALEKH
jgi:ferrous-iron efflux pump FieF